MRSKEVRVENRIGDIERHQRLRDRMLAAERAQVDVVQGLHAERDAIDAGRLEAPEARGLDAGRIGLERDLARPWRMVQWLGDRATESPRPSRATSARACRRRRRSSAPRGPARARRDAPAPREGLDKAVLVDVAAADVAVEVAIGAFRQAERPVDVDAEARVESIPNRRHAPISHEIAENAGQRPPRAYIPRGGPERSVPWPGFSLSAGPASSAATLPGGWRRRGIRSWRPGALTSTSPTTTRRGFAPRSRASTLS